jgi:hypothetical protein
MTHDSIAAAATGAPPGPAPGWRRWHLVAITALTCYSTGIGWQAQLVSYPLFRAVGAEDFLAYHQAYNEAIPLVVIVPGFVGFLACVAFPWTRPREASRWVAGAVALSGWGCLLSTVLWAIPRHDTLDRIGRDAATIDSLLQANAVRTAALTVGAAALVWALVRLLRVARPADRGAA